MEKEKEKLPTIVPCKKRRVHGGKNFSDSNKQ